MPGNITSFDRIDVVRCFLLLQQCKSRATLVKELELGEGSVRTILNGFKEKNLILSTREGHVHSAKGKKIFASLAEKIVLPKKFSSQEFLKNYFPLFQQDTMVTCQILDTTLTIDHEHVYRDYAVKAGADGVLMLTYKKGILKILNFPYSGDFKSITSVLEKKDSIVLVVVAQNYTTAERGALSIIDKMTRLFTQIS